MKDITSDLNYHYDESMLFWGITSSDRVSITYDCSYDDEPFKRTKTIPCFIKSLDSDHKITVYHADEGRLLAIPMEMVNGINIDFLLIDSVSIEIRALLE